MIEVVFAEYLDGYRIHVAFNNGQEGDVDLKDALWGPMFEPLRDMAAFRRFRVSDVLHSIQWENNADLAPEGLLKRMLDQRKSAVLEPR
jgi:hypothetical protein